MKNDTVTKTGVVHNTKTLYWLNVSTTSGPPTNGFKMTRRGLKELSQQIDRVLAGYVGGGWCYSVQKGKVVLGRVRFNRRKPGKTGAHPTPKGEK